MTTTTKRLRFLLAGYKKDRFVLHTNRLTERQDSPTDRKTETNTDSEDERERERERERMREDERDRDD